MKIEMAGVVRKYPAGETDFVALKGISLEIPAGEFIVILGPSGSGKSTLLNLIGGIDRPDAGRILIDGFDLAGFDERMLSRYRRRKVGFVFQSSSLIADLTVRENIEVTAHLHERPIPVGEAMRMVGLSEKADKFPHELSGGEQQRASIARAITKRPALLLCDEPTGSLDYECAHEILALLEDINRKDGATVIVVTHNAAIAAMADRVVRLRSGEIINVDINPAKSSAKDVSW